MLNRKSKLGCGIVVGALSCALLWPVRADEKIHNPSGYTAVPDSDPAGITFHVGHGSHHGGTHSNPGKGHTGAMATLHFDGESGNDVFYVHQPQTGEIVWADQVYKRKNRLAIRIDSPLVFIQKKAKPSSGWRTGGGSQGSGYSATLLVRQGWPQFERLIDSKGDLTLWVGSHKVLEELQEDKYHDYDVTAYIVPTPSGGSYVGLTRDFEQGGEWAVERTEEGEIASDQNGEPVYLLDTNGDPFYETQPSLELRFVSSVTTNSGGSKTFVYTLTNYSETSRDFDMPGLVTNASPTGWSGTVEGLGQAQLTVTQPGDVYQERRVFIASPWFTDQEDDPDEFPEADNTVDTVVPLYIPANSRALQGSLTGASATVTGAGQVTLSYTVDTESFDTVEIQRTDGTGDTLIVTSSAPSMLGQRTCVDQGVPPGQYSYAIIGRRSWNHVSAFVDEVEVEE